MANEDIKTKAKENSICLWRIADKLGIADCSFSRKLRKELSADQRKQVFDIIDELITEQTSKSN